MTVEVDSCALDFMTSSCWILSFLLCWDFSQGHNSQVDFKIFFFFFCLRETHYDELPRTTKCGALPLVWASVAASVKCIVLTYVDHWWHLMLPGFLLMKFPFKENDANEKTAWQFQRSILDLLLINMELFGNFLK